MKRVMHIGDEVFVHGYVDEIRNDTIIIRNAGGYFGTSRDEVCYEDDGYGTMNEALRKTEPQKKEVEWVYNKRERLWYPYSNGELLFKDKPTTQTETQNSNLTFEKRTMRDCYNCKRYETEGECIECKFEPKDEPQMGDAKPIPLSNRVTHIKDEPQTDCSWQNDEHIPTDLASTMLKNRFKEQK